MTTNEFKNFEILHIVQPKSLTIVIPLSDSPTSLTQIFHLKVARHRVAALQVSSGYRQFPAVISG